VIENGGIVGSRSSSDDGIWKGTVVQCTKEGILVFLLIMGAISNYGNTENKSPY